MQCINLLAIKIMQTINYIKSFIKTIRNQSIVNEQLKKVRCTIKSIARACIYQEDEVYYFTVVVCQNEFFSNVALVLIEGWNVVCARGWIMLAFCRNLQPPWHN